MTRAEKAGLALDLAMRVVMERMKDFSASDRAIARRVGIPVAAVRKLDELQERLAFVGMDTQ